MSRAGQLVFVDTGAWIALALARDPYHARARDAWDELRGARLRTSVPVVVETFTFLQRNARQDVALTWKDSISDLSRLKILPCSVKDLDESWAYFRRSTFHKLSAVDASSFAIMTRVGIRTAFAFDHHFATAGFRMVG